MSAPSDHAPPPPYDVGELVLPDLPRLSLPDPSLSIVPRVETPTRPPGTAVRTAVVEVDLGATQDGTASGPLLVAATRWVLARHRLRLGPHGAEPVVRVATEGDATHSRGERADGGGFLVLRAVAARGLLLDAPALGPDDVVALTLGAATRRPTVVTSSTGQESLALRSLALLSLSHDTTRVDPDSGTRLLLGVAAALETAGTGEGMRTWTSG